jgi:aspartate aminotransferase-like enzyme
MTPPKAPSILSLTDIKANWLDAGRGALPGMPSALEFWALDAALDRIEAETLPAVIARHERAARASLAALVAMGVTPWVSDAAEASTLATAAPVPAGIDPSTLLAAASTFGVALTPGFGEVRGRLVRLDHAGARANFGPVLANVIAYGQALRTLGQTVDLGAAADAVAKAYT